MTSNKNGFEIRADILKLAQDHLHTGFFTANQQYENTISSPEWKNVQVAKPAFPSTQQVLETAKEMYTFVNTQVQHNDSTVALGIVTFQATVCIFFL